MATLHVGKDLKMPLLCPLSRLVLPKKQNNVSKRKLHLKSLKCLFDVLNTSVPSLQCACVLFPYTMSVLEEEEENGTR